jgi:hypothetical protein
MVAENPMAGNMIRDKTARMTEHLIANPLSDRLFPDAECKGVILFQIIPKIFLLAAKYLDKNKWPLI